MSHGYLDGRSDGTRFARSTQGQLHPAPRGVAVERARLPGRSRGGRGKWTGWPRQTMRWKQWIYHSIYFLSISIYIYIYLYLSISIYIYLYLSISIYIYIYLYLSISIYIYLSIYPSIHPSIHPSIYLSIYLIYRSIHPSIYLSPSDEPTAYSISVCYSCYIYHSSIYIHLYRSTSIYIYKSIIYKWRFIAGKITYNLAIFHCHDIHLSNYPLESGFEIGHLHSGMASWHLFMPSIWKNFSLSTRSLI